MNEKIENITIALFTLLFFYVIITVMLNHSLFSNYFYIITTSFVFLFSLYSPINISKIEINFKNFIQFGNTLVIIILALLTFILVNDGTLIPKDLIKNALFSIGWLLIFLFGMYLLSIIGTNVESKNNKIIIARIVLFMFIMTFLVLISLICGLVFSL